MSVDCQRCDCFHPEGEHLPRFTIRTRYHVWTIIDRDRKGAAREHIGARGRGDVAARKLARETCDDLNARHERGENV